MKTKNVVIGLVLSGAIGRYRLQGIFRYLRGRSDWNIHLPQNVAEFRQALKKQVDGIILANVRDTSLLRQMEKTPTPVVFMDIRRDQRKTYRPADVTIMNDDGGIGLLAGRHLASIGNFNCFGFVPYPESKHWCERRRLGFAKYLRGIGHVPFVFNWRGETTLSEWLKNLPKPSAIFCACDYVARDTLDACKVNRIKVPDQLVILGVDNDELICQIARPELSSIIPDAEGSGFESAKALHKLMESPQRHSPKVILMKPNGVAERTSTHPPPPAAHLIRNALSFIDESATQGITPEDVAKHVKCSRRLLDMRLSQFHHPTLHSAIVQAKLKAVRRELASSEAKLKEIAAACGFKNAATLKNLFRKTYGTSMREWRKKHRQSDTRQP